MPVVRSSTQFQVPHSYGPNMNTEQARTAFQLYPVDMGQTLLDKLAEELLKAQKLQRQGMAADRAQKPDVVRTCRLQRQAALREALGHVNALSNSIQGEMQLLAAELSE